MPDRHKKAPDRRGQVVGQDDEGLFVQLSRSVPAVAGTGFNNTVAAGAFFSGTPARLSVSVASGVPTISIVSGGSGYLGGGSGNINLTIVGGCTTQMVANATVTNGVLRRST